MVPHMIFMNMDTSFETRAPITKQLRNKSVKHIECLLMFLHVVQKNDNNDPSTVVVCYVCYGVT